LPFHAYICSKEEDSVIHLGLSKELPPSGDYFQYRTKNGITGDILSLELNRHVDHKATDARLLDPSVGCNQIAEIFHPEAALAQGRIGNPLSRNADGDLVSTGYEFGIYVRNVTKLTIGSKQVYP